MLPIDYASIKYSSNLKLVQDEWKKLSWLYLCTILLKGFQNFSSYRTTGSVATSFFQRKSGLVYKTEEWRSVVLYYLDWIEKRLYQKRRRAHNLTGRERWLFRERRPGLVDRTQSPKIPFTKWLSAVFSLANHRTSLKKQRAPHNFTANLKDVLLY